MQNEDLARRDGESKNKKKTMSNEKKTLIGLGTGMLALAGAFFGVKTYNDHRSNKA